MALTLKAWRRARDLSQEEIANKLDVHVNTYRAWENKPDQISIDNAKKLCGILGVNFDDIIFLPEDSTKCSSSIEK